MSNRAIIVVGLGYGDEGKGTIVDWLTREYNADLIVRYNGGPQAAHNVVGTSGRHHTFAQFGSGMFAPGVKTFLSRHMLIDPIAMLWEEEALKNVGVPDAMERTFVDMNAIIISPWHRAANKLRELARGLDRHGSCGMGIGETKADILAGKMMLCPYDILEESTLIDKLLHIQSYKREQMQKELPDDLTNAKEWDPFMFGYREIVDLAKIYKLWVEKLQGHLVASTFLQAYYQKGERTAVFEGAQGVLLDERYGFHPYTTWSNTTTLNAEAMLQEISEKVDVKKVGVVRSYMTRHGPGPFVTEDKELAKKLLPREAHNATGAWQGEFRIGHFDVVALKYAVMANTISSSIGKALDALAITCLDSLPETEMKLCMSYKYEGETWVFNPFWVGWTLEMQAELTKKLMGSTPGAYATSIMNTEFGAGPIKLIKSYGPTAIDKKINQPLW